MTYVVIGLGGRSEYPFPTEVPGSVIRYNANVGALVVDAGAHALKLRFVTIDEVVRDDFVLSLPD